MKRSSHDQRHRLRTQDSRRKNFPSVLTSHVLSLTSGQHPGLTLVELLLFIGLLTLASGAVMGLLFLTSENRVRQSTTADVEQNGLQLIQFLENEARQAERILDPARGTSGSILTLQMSDEETNPVVIGALSGTVLLVRKDGEYGLTPAEVTVSDFRVWNTSPSNERPSLFVSFTMSGIAPLAQSGAYTRTFQTGMTLFPDARIVGDSCGCGPPSCVANTYRWFVCNTGTCSPLSGSLKCP